MLKAIKVTAKKTQELVTQILELINKTQYLIQKEAPSIYSKDLVEIIFKYPYCKIQFIERAGIAKRQTASYYLKTLGKIGILREFKIILTRTMDKEWR